MRRILALSATAVVLAGCVPQTGAPVFPQGPQPSESVDDACGASGLQSFLGKDQSVLAATTFAVPIRIIRPGTAVTMDFSPGRLNIELDARGKIVRVYCG